jgi:hypothetical protein
MLRDDHYSLSPPSLQVFLEADNDDILSGGRRLLFSAREDEVQGSLGITRWIWSGSEGAPPLGRGKNRRYGCASSCSVQELWHGPVEEFPRMEPGGEACLLVVRVGLGWLGES